MFVRLVLVMVLIADVTSFPFYQSLIPNGGSVPFPCKPGQTWEGVGHYLPFGTGERNPFGLDFAAAGRTWSEDLCRKDSDGDGMTNGQELGDPDCVWKKNDVPKRTTGLSHPGICDPWNSPVCLRKPLTGRRYNSQHAWMTDACEGEGFHCAALNETGTANMTVRIAHGTQVPPKDTLYICQIFDTHALGLPGGQDFHLVAVTPILDNIDLLHHMVLSGCSNDILPTAEAYDCEMLASEKCQDVLHVWTLGSPGECYHQDSGVRLGHTGYRMVSLQVHLHNRQHISGLTDSSGLLLHYTPKLRPYDAGIFPIGLEYFTLPPGKPEVTLTGSCTSQCSRSRMTGPLQITSVRAHMHLTGLKMTIQVIRNNTVIGNLTDNVSYIYDSPQVKFFPQSFELQPGDALRTRCEFNTLNKNATIFFGERLQDEMCYGFVTFHPKGNMLFPDCMDFEGASQCSLPGGIICSDMDVVLQRVKGRAAFREVSAKCQPFSPCGQGCQEAVHKLMGEELCIQGSIWKYMEAKMVAEDKGHDLRSLISTCKI